jgi:hypothetical protein
MRSRTVSIRMPRRVSGSSIAVSFSTRGALMPAWMVQHVAGMADVDGIDVDATSQLGAWLATLTGTSESPSLPVRSIWLPVDGLRTPRIRRLVDAAHHRQPDLPPLIVLVIPGAAAMRDWARSFQQVTSSALGWSLAIGLPAASLRGGRPHLVHLGGIRRYAEEWELVVALDLAGRFDPTWEAEAAVSRIGHRLRMLRLTTSAPSRAAVGRDRVACRALHAAIDRAERLDVALASARSVPFAVTPRSAARSAERAADYVSERALFHAQARREGIGRYEDSPSPRGN